MKLGMGFLIATVFLMSEAYAGQSFEVTCRAKAKEIAAETYRNCVTEKKTSQIEQVRADYQQRLKALKDEYEKEIQSISGGKKISNKAVQKRTKKSPAPTIESSGGSDESTMDIPEPVPLEENL